MKRLFLYHIEPYLRISSMCSAYIGIHPPEYSYEGESHDFWEAVFILKGTVGVTAGESIYTLEEGNMILHPPGEFHRVWNAGQDFMRVAIVSFGADVFPINTHLICPFSSKKDVFATIRHLRKVFDTQGIFIVGTNDAYKRSDSQRALAALEGLLLDILDQSGANTQNIRKDRLSEIYSNAVSIMRENIGKRMSSQEIAAACGTSVSTLQKIFFRYTGVGLMKYYEGVRMQRAKELLEMGHLVKQTALALGYNDPNYFSAAYKRYYGISPSNNKT